MKTYAFAIPFLLVASLANGQSFVTAKDFPSVNFDALNSGDPVPDNSGRVFIHNGYGWIVTAPPAPLPKVSPIRSAVNVPTEDEYLLLPGYTSVETAPLQPVLVRTANKADWFKAGKMYRHAYAAFIKIGRVEFRCEDIGYGEVCDLFQIGTVIGNDAWPEGTEIPFRLFAPRGPWTEVP